MLRYIIVARDLKFKSRLVWPGKGRGDIDKNVNEIDGTKNLKQTKLSRKNTYVG